MRPVDRPVVSPVLVGRAREWEILDRARAGVQHGTGQCVMLAGEAGVGKSRLLAELRRRADEMGFVVVQGHCFESDLTFPHAPLIDALRSFLASRQPPEVADLLGPLGPELVKLLPELALILPIVPTPSLDPEAEKRRLFEALAQVFRRTAGERPLLLIIEDLHWSDETSLDFVHLLARRIAAAPTLLVASYRREEATPALSHLLAQLERQRLVEEITLAPLGRDEVGAMLQAIFDLAQPVRAEFLDAIFALTEGNPFFVEEVLKSLIAAGDIFYAEGVWDRKPLAALRIPRSVQDAVQRRADRLSEPARQLLSLAAVAGRRFDFALLQSLTGHGEARLLALIKELMAAQLVIEESADRFAFRHALTREAIYIDLLARERRALHQRIGAMLEQLHADALDAHAAELAAHFYEAGDWERVLCYSQQAGAQAQARYAPRAAVVQFTRALTAVEKLGRLPPPALYRARGLAQESLGHFAEQQADLESALSSAQALGDRAAEWQALLDLGMMWAARDYRQTHDYLQRALTLARTMDDRGALAHSLNRLGNWLMNMEQPLEALPHHREALTIFEALGDQRGLATTLDLLGTSFYGSGDALAGAAAYQQAATLFRELNERAGLVSTLGMLALRAGCAINDASVAVPSSQDDAMREAEEALAMAREMGHRPGELFALVVLVYCLAAQGHYDRALPLAERALALAIEIDHHHLLLFAQLAAGALALDLLDGATAQQHLEQALALARRGGSPYWTRVTSSLLAPALHLQNQRPAAVALLDELLRDEEPPCTSALRQLWCARAELALAEGAAERALAIVEQMAAADPHLAALGEVAAPRLAVMRGTALAALGRADDAERALRAARDGAAQQACRPRLWRAHLALGRFYRTQRRHDEAAAELTAANALVTALAATVPDPARRDLFLRAATAMMPPVPSSPRRAAKRRYAGLTRREREVAALIARGFSNRAISEALVLSERTVGGHVGNILAKLGFSSRVQVARWAVEKGLVPPDEERT